MTSLAPAWSARRSALLAAYVVGFLAADVLGLFVSGGYSGITTYPIGEFAALGTLLVMLGIAANVLLHILRPRLQ
jgi:hypothetical protein